VIKVMFGAEPSKPMEIAPAAQMIHFHKKGNRDLIAEKLHARAHAEHKNTWRNRRWATLIVANLLFVLSFALDIQILEGALTASRFVGFPLIDLNSALQVMLAHKHIINNMLIGTVLVLWALIYVPGVALLWVLALLVFEVFFSRLAWCRYACPIGLTYGVVGIISPVRIK
jgi:ferredoxin-type protein NapH